MPSSGMLRRVALVITGVSEEHVAFNIRVTRISEEGTTLAVTSKGRTLRRYTISSILVILMMEALKRRFLKEPHGVTFQKTEFFMNSEFR
jgi:hypothetical protein